VGRKVRGVLCMAKADYEKMKATDAVSITKRGVHKRTQ
jgi:hypothetical protein